MGFGCAIFSKNLPISNFFYILVLFSPTHPILEAFCENPPKSCKTAFGPNKLKKSSKVHLQYEFEKVWIIKQLRIITFKNIASKMVHFCEAPRKMIQTTLVKSKYFEVLLGQSGESKSKCTLKPILSQNLVYSTWRTNSVPMDQFYCSNWPEE